MQKYRQKGSNGIKTRYSLRVSVETISDSSIPETVKRGDFTTPDVLARFLVGWAIRNPNDMIIDTCCGDGIFLEASSDRLLFLGAEESVIHQLTGVEIDPSTAKQ